MGMGTKFVWLWTGISGRLLQTRNGPFFFRTPEITGPDRLRFPGAFTIFRNHTYLMQLNQRC